MRDHRLSATGAELPGDLSPAVDAYEQSGEWVSAITLLLTEGERRAEVHERVACYLRAAAIYERQFANAIEAQQILEHVLRLSPDEPAAILRLRDLYTRGRHREKLRWLAGDRQKLAAEAPVPRMLASSPVAASAGGLPARIGAAGFFIVLPASVAAANISVNTLVEPHDNGDGVLGWLIFVSLDLVFCAAFIALAYLPARWALRRVGGRALLAMLALLAATFLIALVPTLGWNAIDAANVLLDPRTPSAVRVRVIEHVRRGRSKGRFSVVQELSERSGPTLLTRSLGFEPVGSEHVLLRGGGFFRRRYYQRAQ
ncbi:MAG TPA: hypothetical protein VFU02_03990 [Polyangiaceae bacterium]|nr:hypothetical protein [Polyangiaceae bacterium]